ncbi:hypothetical protein BS78_01G166300 [Paspalum vaginatum]|nr:hypothetical protein BS78_01G166300 [Paspalum vaginatum]
MASKSSTTAALFLATTLLLAAAATMAQAQVAAPAPAPSTSICPLPLPITLAQVVSNLENLSAITAFRCACVATQGATSLAVSVLGLFGVNLPVGITCN